MSTEARVETAESYALSALVLVFVTAGIIETGRKGEKKKDVSGRMWRKCLRFPRDMFGDSHSFVVVLARRGLSYLWRLSLSLGGKWRVSLL